MSKNFVQSAALRSLAVRAYRLYARAQFWRTGPRIFINSIPKAGTHLVTAELERFQGLQHSRLHIEIAETKVGEQRRPDANPVLDYRKVARYVDQVRPGQFFSAHLFWTQEMQDIIAARGIPTVFVLRDPRDILISRLHYTAGLQRHWMHKFFTENYHSDVERLRLLVMGHEANPVVIPMRNVLESFQPWLTAPGVLSVKFEDLVGERGGGSAARKLEVLQQIATHCGLPSGHLEELAKTATGSTPTLRKGKIGGWREDMPKEIADLVHRECGDLIKACGYALD